MNERGPRRCEPLAAAPPQCTRICFKQQTASSIKDSPGSQVRSSFSLGSKAKRREERELVTAPSPRIETGTGARSGGGGGTKRSLPYAGRAHGSQGRLPLGRSRVSAVPCPAWSPLSPALPALCVSSVRSPRDAAGSGLSPAGRPRPVQHWTAPAATAARYPASRRPLPSATAAFQHQEQRYRPCAPRAGVLRARPLSRDSRLLGGMQDFSLAGGPCGSHSATGSRGLSVPAALSGHCGPGSSPFPIPSDRASPSHRAAQLSSCGCRGEAQRRWSHFFLIPTGCMRSTDEGPEGSLKFLKKFAQFCLPALPYREGPELKLHSLGCICPPPPNLRTLGLGKAEVLFGSGSRVQIITLKMTGFPGGSAGKEFVCNAGDLGSIPGLGRSPGEGKGSPLQYSFRPGEFHGL